MSCIKRRLRGGRGAGRGGRGSRAAEGVGHYGVAGIGDCRARPEDNGNQYLLRNSVISDVALSKVLSRRKTGAADKASAQKNSFGFQ